MKIAIVGLHIEASISGEAESQRNLAENLKALGHQVDLIQNADLSSMDAKTSSWRERSWGKFLNLLSMPKLIAARCQGYDLVQLNLPTPAVAFLADRLASRLSCPLVVQFDSQLNDQSFFRICKLCFHEPLFFIPRLLINNSFWGRLTVKRARGFIVSTEYQKLQLLALGYKAKKISVIANLTRKSFYSSVAQPVTAIRSKLKLPDTRIITYIGHLFYVKGTETLLRAFAKSKLAGCLVLAHSGLGNLESVLRLAHQLGIKNRICVLGKVDVAELLTASDLVMLPYQASFGTMVLPNLILESMAVGVPIVTSNLGPLRELQTYANVVLLAEPGSDVGFAEQVDKLLTDVELAAEMVSEQRKLMASTLHPVFLAKKFETFYLSLLNSRTKNG